MTDAPEGQPPASQPQPNTQTATVGIPVGMPPGMPLPVQLLLPGIVQQQSVQLWQGQFPPPEAVERYEKVHPGAFDRMIRMAEESQRTQGHMAELAIEGVRTDTRRGHWLGFLLSMSAMTGALILGLLHVPWVAGAFLSVPVMGVAKALIDSVRRPTQAIQMQPTKPHQ